MWLNAISPFFIAISGGLIISIINVTMNLHIDDGSKGYKNYTLNFTSSSMGGEVQFPPVPNGDLRLVFFSSLS